MGRSFYAARRADPLVAVVREVAGEHAEQSTLRGLAPDIGIGHTTLHNFLSGANPHPRVWRALREWYAREQARSVTEREKDQLWLARERMRTQGVGALSASELVAVLFAGGDGETRPNVDASLELLREFSPDDAQALRRIMAAGLATVSGVRGLGDAQAAALLAGLEIGRRAVENGGA
jgi:hypothetical protein